MGGQKKDIREFPTVGREEQVDGMVVEVRLRAEVAVYHPSDGCGAVCVCERVLGGRIRETETDRETS